MKSIFLIRNGAAETAFEIKESKIPECGEEEVQIKVEAFGLNFADVMCRLGHYRDCPKLPCVIGYEVTGRIEAVGKNVQHLQTGERVAALIRFGGYAEFALADSRAVMKIPDSIPAWQALALSTQYCTAYYCAEELVRLHLGDQVLIHAAAGGVGLALVQIALMRECTVFATAGSEEKISYLKSIGVQHAINYREKDFANEIKQLAGGKKLDVIFDSVGGPSVKKGYKLLAAGGRIVVYGAAELSQGNIFSRWKKMLAFGLYHPGLMAMQSKSILGAYMLPLATQRPEVLQRVMQSVMKLHSEGKLVPLAGKTFPVSELATAHRLLEERKTIGKVAIAW